MAKNFTILLEKMDPERLARIDKRVAKTLRRMALKELRQAREQTQAEIGESLHIKQAGISRIERQTDIYISTLRRYVEALGGELQVVAKFSDTRIEIDQFHDEKLAG
ncbi:XRE family transcriptional regulator [soil metagenome]